MYIVFKLPSHLNSGPFCHVFCHLKMMYIYSFSLKKTKTKKKQYILHAGDPQSLLLDAAVYCYITNETCFCLSQMHCSSSIYCIAALVLSDTALFTPLKA